MEKLDFKKTQKELYQPSAKLISVVTVPAMNFLMVDGAGNPNTVAEYHEAVEALYAVSYALKFQSKRAKAGIDYTVFPLEGQWWSDDWAAFTTWRNKDLWQWTMMIRQPDFLTAAHVTEAMVAVAKKKTLPALPRLRFAAYDEGLSVQQLYIGAYDDEGPAIAALHDYIAARGYVERGHHHEIYLSDPRKVESSKLKTILRQPVTKK